LVEIKFKIKKETKKSSPNRRNLSLVFILYNI